jgi:Transmembrane Fragile-X-F protein
VVVFSVKVKQPRSVAGWVWSLGQEALAVFSLTVIGLKLAGVIAWSWWWVLSPLWISGVVVAAVGGGLLVLICRGMTRRRVPAPRPEPPDGMRPPRLPTWQELGSEAPDGPWSRTPEM